MKILVRFIHLLVALIMWLVAKVVGLAVQEVTHDNPVGSIAVMAVAVMYLAVSFVSHRKRIGEASAEALRIANREGSTEDDWAPFAYTASQVWIDVRPARRIFFGMVVFGIDFGLALALGSKSAAHVIASFFGIAIGFCEWARDADREERAFQDSLKAANQGRWSPPLKNNGASELVGGKLRDIAEEIVSKVEDGITDHLKLG